jgi:hypothetical protein
LPSHFLPLSPASWHPHFHFPHLLVYVFGHRGCRFKSKVRSLDHFEELLMSGLALLFVLLDCCLPFPAWSRSSMQLGRVMGLPGRCPEAQGWLMTLHYGKAVITFCSLATSLITQGTLEGQDDCLPGYPSPLLVVANERSGQKQAVPPRW